MAKKPPLLSAEISKARALLAGGASGVSVLGILREWQLVTPVRGTNRTPIAILSWCRRVSNAVREGLPLGSPIGLLLKEVQPFIRSDERRWLKLRAVERQYAFQGAIGAVLPWAVGALTGGLEVNLFTISGSVTQIFGLSVYTLLVRRSIRKARTEESCLFDLAVATWMRVLSGLSVRSALEGGLASEEPGDFRSTWLRWLEAHQTGTELLGFDWPGGFELSRDFAGVMAAAMKTGAPAAEVISDLIVRMDEERQAELDERLAALPTRLSLVFCATIVPAVFLILIGGLWPTLESSWM